MQHGTDVRNAAARSFRGEPLDQKNRRPGTERRQYEQRWKAPQRIEMRRIDGSIPQLIEPLERAAKRDRGEPREQPHRQSARKLPAALLVRTA